MPTSQGLRQKWRRRVSRPDSIQIGPWRREVALLKRVEFLDGLFVLAGFDLQRAGLICTSGEYAGSYGAEDDALFLLAVIELHHDDGSRVVVAGCRAGSRDEVLGPKVRKIEECSFQVAGIDGLGRRRDLFPCVDGVLARALDPLERAHVFAARNLEPACVEGPEVEHFLPP